jgi:hypothetical protein
MATIAEIHGEVAAYVASHPEQSFKTISEKLHCSLSTVSAIARKAGIRRRPRALTEEALKALEPAIFVDPTEEMILNAKWDDPLVADWMESIGLRRPTPAELAEWSAASEGESNG